MTRPSGNPPYWEAGDHIWWRYRSRGWEPGRPEHLAPVRVVRDDADGLVVWLAPRTPVLRGVLSNGEDIRTVGADRMFRVPRVQARTRWRGNGTLKIAPTGMPWSVWLFWNDDGSFANWYVNLEAPHRRDDRNVYSRDHTLDLVVAPDRTVRWKDEDELAGAIQAGRYTEDEAAEFVQQARDVEKRIARWEPPFSDGWESWRPDPTWPVPQLPTDIAAEIVHDDL